MNAVSSWRRTMKTSGPSAQSRRTMTVEAGRGFTGNASGGIPEILQGARGFSRAIDPERSPGDLPVIQPGRPIELRHDRRPLHPEPPLVRAAARADHRVAPHAP